MKGHEADPRYTRRRRDTCILWALGTGAVVTLLWLTVFITLLLTTGDKVFQRRYPRLVPHPYATVFGEDAASAIAQRIASKPPDAHETDVASVPHTIDGRTIVVVDGAISETARAHIADTYVKLAGARVESGWSREKASDASVEGNAMAKDLPYAECGGGAGLVAVRAIAPHFFDQCSPARPIWATRCTVYAQTFADVDEAHEDRSHDGDAFSVTAIWYPHERWHPHWGGETVFLSDSGGGQDAELLLLVLPKPGRLVMFDSEQPHMSESRRR